MAQKTSTFDLSLRQPQTMNIKQAKNFFNLGKVLAKKGEWEEAIAAYQKAIKLAPDWEEVKQYLADAENQLQQQEANVKLTMAEQLGKVLATQQADSEKVAPGETIKVNSNLAEDYLLQGDALLEKGDKEEAIRVYRKAVEIQPELWEKYHKLGNLSQEKEELEVAITAYQKSIYLNPGFCWSYYNLGDVLVKIEKWEKAVYYYYDTIKLNPNFCWSYYNLGDIFVKLEKWKQAVYCYCKTIKLNPNFCWSYHKLGDVLVKLKKKKEAIRYYKKAIELQPKFGWSYYKLAEIYLQLEYWDKAIKAYSQLMKIHPEKIHPDFPTKTQLYLSLGNAWCAKGEVEKAARAFKKVISLSPDFHEAYSRDFHEAYVKLMKIKNQKNEMVFGLKEEIKWNNNRHQRHQIDILIITALKDELDALKNCDNQSGNTWEELKDSRGYPYYKTTLNHKNGTKLNIVAAIPPEIGEINSSILATRLISELKPRCLAMTGVCAGNKKDVFLGDIIVANRVFKFDYGKLIAHYESINNQQIRTEEIFHDIHSYNLNLPWKLTIQNFPKDWLNTIQTPRPKSFYHQERCLLHKLYDYQQQPNEYSRPDKHLERQIECADWRAVIQRLRKQELLKKDSLELTEKALEEVKKERVEYLKEQHYKDPSNPKIHTGVIATTSKVQKDPQLFQRIEKLQRQILGVEMEGAAIGAVAEIHKIPMIIVKGVQDYADYDKNDQFREYAAEVSARFLLAFFTTI